MPIEKSDDGRMTFRFGTGDIMIAPAVDDQNDREELKTLHVSIGTINNGEKFPIDVPQRQFDNQPFPDWAIRMYFEKVESINAMIHVLEEVKRLKFNQRKLIK